MAVTKIAIIGVGATGRGIAQVAAVAGYDRQIGGGINPLDCILSLCHRLYS